ncbi:cyclase family protein [Pleionea sediminis]|uniref:cyclase family protein n=1 Tax=Pleionea sediminis TaxID=2569479 RepID=UPI00118656D2|nr:cyclase family protein [Pleionea sediminis]
MKLILDIDKQLFTVNSSSPISLAIPLLFDGAQPNHFGAPKASAKAIESDGFIGDTSRGGSCNVKEISFVPHCNGTHTESVSHIVSDSIPVGKLAQSLIPATVISVIPHSPSESTDYYQPSLEATDRIISKKLLTAELSEINSPLLEALIIRTLPNSEKKQACTYSNEQQPPFFTNDAIEYLNDKGIKHLLVDIPSIDKMYDDGILSNHHIYWNVPQRSHVAVPATHTEKTITEMIFVPETAADGHYLLSLNIPSFESDAGPSRPVIYPLENQS